MANQPATAPHMTHRRKVSTWEVNKGLAREILRHRGDRRRMLAWLLSTVLGLMVGGLWVIDAWLAAGIWRFLLWWGACGFLTFLLLLAALYDCLAVIREERDRLRPPAPDRDDGGDDAGG